MPFDRNSEVSKCTVCGSDANFRRRGFGVGEIVDCLRCGDYRISHEIAYELGLPFNEPKKAALASHLIRQMQKSSPRPSLTKDFFESLQNRKLPTPAAAMDNLILWLGEQLEGTPGDLKKIDYSDISFQAEIGVVGLSEIVWILPSLSRLNLVNVWDAKDSSSVNLTVSGWEKWEELKRGHAASRFAFFARKFTNAELDYVFEHCLRLAVEETGYELRTVTQQAGLVDAVMEDEIRRCRFLIADLSDMNAGAYWEAGFAEGLGKPVIYICKAATETHFDTNHRHTVRWDVDALERTSLELKAVIRNTLLGDAKPPVADTK